MRRTSFLAGFIVVSFLCFTSDVMAVDGWASMNGGTTGGAGGDTVTATNATDFINYVQNTGQTPLIVQVSGNINLGSSNIRVRGNKTVIGLPGSHITGNLKCYRAEESNNIFKNLSMDNYDKVGDGDCISLDSVQNIWIDHCTFTDGGDGNVDIKNGSDYITVSWCIFKYTYDSDHNFSNLVGHSDGNGGTDRGHLLVTFHHNWWYTMAKERMPRVRFGQVHVYNNYYSDLLAGGYCHGVGVECQILVENNYYDSVPNPWKNYSSGGTQGKIGWNSGNEFVDCEIPTWAPNDYDNIFTPPYSYTLDDGVDVKSIVMAGAGAGGGGDTTPPAAPTNLTATAGDGQVSLDWDDNSEPDLDGYNIYRSTTSGGPYGSPLNGSLLSSSEYTDNSVTNGITYYYVVTAVDTSLNESDDSSEVSATPSDTTPPSAPTGLSATPGDGTVSLDWDDNGEGDLDGYNVYRSTTPGGPYGSPLNGSLLTTSDYTDNSVTNGTTYYYVVTTVDTSLNESDDSSEVSALPSSISGSMGTILREWWTGISGSSVSDLTSDPCFPDNPTGSNQLTSLEAPTDWADSYGTLISGYLHPPTGGSYTFWIASDANSELWLSTDGDPENASMIANVPGYTNPRQWDKYLAQQSSPISLDAGQKYYIEVLHKEDTGSDNLAVAWSGPGISQQIIYGVYLSPWFIGLYGDSTGNGIVDMNDLSDFMAMWMEDDCAESSAWDLNGDCIINFYEFSELSWNWLVTEQDTTPPAAPTGLSATPGDGTVSLDWDDNSEPDLDGYNVYRSTSSGGPYGGPLNGSLLSSSDYTDNSVTNGITYYYVVTAVDTNNNESGDSNEDSATPDTPAEDVEILGSWVTDTTHTKESGSDRALIFIAHWEDNVAPSLTVTYGGQTMTKVIDITAGETSFRNYVAAFILDEAGIDAASGDTFTPTWGDPPSSVSYASVFLQNVDQTDIIGATDSASTTSSTPNPITTNPLSTEDGDMVILAAVCGNNGSYTLNNDFTEGTDQSVGSNGHTGVTGHKVATGADETPSATFDATPNRQVIIGFVVRH